ncbi:MAG: porin, partial [Rhodospirillaceae bacterium]
VMNKLLCAGGAAIALTAASPAAAAGFDIKIGGDADFTAGYVSQSYDTSGQPKGDFTNRFRINVTPTATADNGMEYGASLRFRAYAANGTIDAQRAYLFADGGLGRVEAGAIAGPNGQYGITAPGNFGTGGVIGEWAMGPGWLTNQNTFLEPAFGYGFDAITDTTWATRINYFTPRFFAQSDTALGLMGALSFAPRILDLGASANRVRTITTTGQSYCAATLPSTPLSGCGYRNVIEAGLIWDGEIGDVTLSASLGYQHGESPSDSSGVAYHPLQAYQAGLLLSWEGFEIGGSYLDAGKSSYARNRGYYLNDQTAVTAGLSYHTGPWSVGFNYIHGEDAGDVTVPGKRTADMYSVGVTYTVAAGLTTSLEYLRSLTANEPGYKTDAFGNDARGTPATPGDIGYGSGNGTLVLWKTILTF